MIEIDIYKTLEAADGEMELRIQLNIAKGEFVTLYGASGAGKTSTFRILSGLMKADKGTIKVNGKTWFDSAQKINLTPQQRKIAYVFQDYALFPNMTVRQNLEFALRKNQNKKIVLDLIDLMELGALQNKKPEKLSGGQQQRVALARALVQQTEILLLDEPLSALDIKIRLKLQNYLLKLHKAYNLTTIMISHDIGEIIKMADQVLVLEKGKIIKQGTPDKVFINEKVNGDFKLIGEVLKIEQKEQQFIITALIQDNVVKLIAEESAVKELKLGDKIMLVSKTFNPTIHKIHSLE